MTTTRRRRPGRVVPGPGPFADRVRRVVAAIPPGRVLTYGDVAALAGHPAAARAVGQILSKGTVPDLPYHRVIGAGGRIGGYGGAPALKAGLLRAEGLTLRGGRIVGFDAVRWIPAGKARGPAHAKRAREVAGPEAPTGRPSPGARGSGSPRG